MSRPLRFVPEHSLVEITTRTFQGRLLLKPSPELTEGGGARGFWGVSGEANARGEGARGFWGSTRWEGARGFWGGTRNFLASWPIATYVQTTAIRSGALPRRNHHADLSGEVAAQTVPRAYRHHPRHHRQGTGPLQHAIHAFVFLSTHSHFLLSPNSAGQLLG